MFPHLKLLMSLFFLSHFSHFLLTTLVNQQGKQLTKQTTDIKMTYFSKMQVFSSPFTMKHECLLWILDWRSGTRERSKGSLSVLLLQASLSQSRDQFTLCCHS